MRCPRIIPLFYVLACSGVATAADTPPVPPGLEQIYKEELPEALRLMAPMTPADISRQRERLDQQEKASEATPAQMRTETRVLTLQPGAAPHAVRVSKGYASTIIFTDATGAPWPVTAYIVGDPKAYNVVQPEGLKPGNLLSVLPLTNHGASNLTVTLENQTYPVVIHLLTESSANSRRVSDALVSFRVDQRGPNAQETIVGPSRAPTVNPTMMTFLDGVPPEGATPLNVSSDADDQGPNIAVWSYRGRYYLRSVSTMIWPAWIAMANGGDGIKVYEIPPAPSLLLSYGGQSLAISVEDLGGTSK